jgi:hypothetical protein
MTTPLTTAGNVWNRAALTAGGPVPCEGDRALADLLFAHGLVMNGGVDHLVEVASVERIAAAVRGFRFYGLDEVASLLEDVARGPCDLEEATQAERALPSAPLRVDQGETVPIQRLRTVR